MPTIYIHDSNQSALWGMIQHEILCDATLQVYSVAHLVTEALKIIEPGRALNELVLGGESSENYQSIGANGKTDTTGDKSFQLDEKGKLKGGGGRYLPLLKGRIEIVRFLNLQTSPANTNLMIEIGRALGTGTKIITPNTFFIYYGDRVGRRATFDATLDREALKARLDQFAGK